MERSFSSSARTVQGQVMEQWKSHFEKCFTAFNADNIPDSLISPRSYRQLIFAFKWGHLLGGLPLEYEEQRGKVKITKTAVRAWLIMVTAQILHIAVSFATLFRTVWFHKGKGILFDVSYSFVITTVQLYILIPSIHCGGPQRYGFCCFVNTAIDYYIFVKENYGARSAKNFRNGCEELLIMAKLFFLSVPLFSGFNYFHHPEKSIYVTSFVPQNSQWFYPSVITYGIARFATEVSASAAAMEVSFPFVLLSFVFLGTIQEARAGRLRYNLKSSFRDPEDLRIWVRSSQMLGNQINAISRKILLIEQNLMTYTGTVCAVTVVVFWKQLSPWTKGMLIFSGIMTIGIWSTVLSIASMAYVDSQKAFNSWRNFRWTRQEKKEMKLFLKSIRPIQLEFGGFYYIRPKKVLTFWNAVVWYIVRALFTLPKLGHHH